MKLARMCSIAATAGLPDRALYSSSKGAVLSLTFAMAADHLHDGIRVNCVNPGTTDTPWIDRLLDQATDPAAERAALLGHPLASLQERSGIVGLCWAYSGSRTDVGLACRVASPTPGTPHARPSSEAFPLRVLRYRLRRGSGGAGHTPVGRGSRGVTSVRT